MRQCSQCGIRTKYLSFIDGSGGGCFLGKNYGKIVCGDCNRKLKTGEEIKWRGKPSKQTLKLIKLINGLGYKVKPRLERTYAGYWQRTNGAWLWQMELSRMAGWIGSSYTVKEILMAKKVIVSTSSGEPTLEIVDKK